MKQMNKRIHKLIFINSLKNKLLLTKICKKKDKLVRSFFIEKKAFFKNFSFYLEDFIDKFVIKHYLFQKSLFDKNKVILNSKFMRYCFRYPYFCIYIIKYLKEFLLYIETYTEKILVQRWFFYFKLKKLVNNNCLFNVNFIQELNLNNLKCKKKFLHFIGCSILYNFKETLKNSLKFKKFYFAMKSLLRKFLLYMNNFIKVVINKNYPLPLIIEFVKKTNHLLPTKKFIKEDHPLSPSKKVKILWARKTLNVLRFNVAKTIVMRSLIHPYSLFKKYLACKKFKKFVSKAKFFEYFKYSNKMALYFLIQTGSKELKNSFSNEKKFLLSNVSGFCRINHLLKSEFSNFKNNYWIRRWRNYNRSKKTSRFFMERHKFSSIITNFFIFLLNFLNKFPIYILKIVFFFWLYFYNFILFSKSLILYFYSGFSINLLKKSYSNFSLIYLNYSYLYFIKFTNFQQLITMNLYFYSRSFRKYRVKTKGFFTQNKSNLKFIY